MLLFSYLQIWCVCICLNTGPHLLRVIHHYACLSHLCAGSLVFVLFTTLRYLLVGSGPFSMRKVERRNAGTEIWNVVDCKQFKIEFSGLHGTSIEI